MNDADTRPDHASRWPAGAGEMAERIRTFDWAATPLGAWVTWPQALRTAVELMLARPQPPDTAADCDVVETALREREEHQAFLLKLSDALRPLADAEQITAEATRLLAQHLNATRAYYVEWPPSADYGVIRRDYTAPGFASLAGRYPIGAFRGAYEKVSQGRTWVERDNAAADVTDAERRHQAAIGVVAWIDVPLVKAGRLKAVLCLVDGEPRDWTPAEISLVEGTAELTWAAVERARAEARLRDNESRFRAIVETVTDYAIFTTDVDRRIDTWPPGAEAVFGWTEAEALGQPYDITFTPEDREAGEADREWDQARREGSAPNVRWHIRQDGRRVFIDGVSQARYSADGTFEGLLKIGQDVTERRAAQEALRTSEERFRSFADNSADTLWIVDADEQRLEYLSPAFEMMWGEPRDRVMNDIARWGELVHPDDRERAAEAMPRLLGGVVNQVEYRVVRASDGAVRWIQDTGFPIRDENGRVVRAAGIAQDVTDRRQLEDRQRVLLAELQHRVRNIMGVIRSIARRTALTSDTVADYAAHLDGRLNALARVQGILTRSPGRGVDLRELLEDELLAHAAEPRQYALDGPEVLLKAKTAETFALAMHELAVNAVKHGALSTSGARIAVCWRVDKAGERLSFEWREIGVPIAAGAPRRRGFGSELIEQVLAYDLGAAASLEFEPGGVVCTIDLPLHGPPGLTGPHSVESSVL